MRALMRKPTLPEAYALSFRFYRKGMKLSAIKAADAMGMTKQNISSIETFRSQLTLKGLELFLKEYSIPVETLRNTVHSFLVMELIQIEDQFSKNDSKT